MQIIEFEKDGSKVEIDGFRLKNLSQWRSRIPSELDVGAFSSFCNCNCVFCYEKGNTLPYVKRKAFKSIEEAKTRIKYYDKGDKTGLITEIIQELEPFTNPYLFEILSMVRESINDNEVLTITTNGSFLNRETIDKLRCLMPIMIVVSINSRDPVLRQQLMRDKRDITTGIKAIELLKENEIPFIGSIVAWPTIPMEDLRNTIEYVAENEAYAIRVDLPGYTKYFSNKKLFDTKECWDKIVACCNEERDRISCLLRIHPSLYDAQPIIPLIDGIVKNSPAYFAGLKRRDLILKIDEKNIHTRAQAHNILKKKGKEVTIVVKRKQEVIKYTLRESYCYPYVFRNRRDRFGIFFIDDLKLASFVELKKIIEIHNANKVLFFSSEIIKPYVEKIINMVPPLEEFFSKIEFYLEVAEHIFWGGNILLNDLHVVEDYISSTRNFIKENNIKPDLIVIPVTFIVCYGFDLRGTSYKKIERELGIPVELLRCKLINI